MVSMVLNGLWSGRWLQSESGPMHHERAPCFMVTPLVAGCNEGTIGRWFHVGQCAPCFTGGPLEINLTSLGPKMTTNSSSSTRIYKGRHTCVCTYKLKGKDTQLTSLSEKPMDIQSYYLSCTISVHASRGGGGTNPTTTKGKTNMCMRTHSFCTYFEVFVYVSRRYHGSTQVICGCVPIYHAWFDRPRLVGLGALNTLTPQQHRFFIHMGWYTRGL